jgi:hypothetical protein
MASYDRSGSMLWKNVRTEPVQHLVRLRGSFPKLLSLKGAHFRNVSLN